MEHVMTRKLALIALLPVMSTVVLASGDNALRRLERIGRVYGSDPQFICCSATIANPGELAAQLIEHEMEVVGFQVS